MAKSQVQSVVTFFFLATILSSLCDKFCFFYNSYANWFCGKSQFQTNLLSVGLNDVKI